MRAVSLDRLRERVENAQSAYEGAKKAFHEALSGALNGGAQAKKVGWPKGKKRGPRKVAAPAPEPLAPEPKPKKSRVKRNHPWKKKAISNKAPEGVPVVANPATEATD